MREAIITSIVIIAVLFVCVEGHAQTRPATSPEVDVEFFETAAKKFEADIASRDPRRLDGWLDKPAFTDRAIARTKLAADAAQRERTQFIEKIKFEWVPQLPESIGPNGSYRLVRTYTIDGEAHAIYRLLNEARNFNYHDVVLHRDADGRARIVDVFIMSTGDYLSASIADILAKPNTGRTVEELRAEKAEYDRAKQLAVLFREGKHAEAVELYHALAPDVKQQKHCKMVWVAAAARLGRDEHDSAVADYRRSFPDDPSLDVLLIDYYLQREQWTDAIDCIDRLNARVQDAYLDGVSAIPLLKAGRIEDAEQRARKAVAADPALPASRWTLVEVLLGKRDFKGVAEQLLYIEQAFGIRLGDLTAVPVYAEFVASEAYSRWTARRGAIPPQQTPASQPAGSP